MFSFYVKAQHQSPAIIVSYLEQSSRLIHSCHFVLKDTSLPWVICVMLVTYTEYGDRLSCSESEGHLLFLHDTYRAKGISNIVEEHFQVWVSYVKCEVWSTDDR